ncbi:2,4'-dihydroxyacetophenone dioxygenase family protein [Altericroceibacterium endophyticum]|uniref:tRNA modification GTPase n=1 Tax=Altericroceibacterium endophyticum TaxID=1808508 RepID=A0A6I4T611_9SPHN|nr:2,4'-dihydroxyacetophenone dioxygenase family protein [Altericroceibacterium endophyticum]MXO66634.1 tRNA modification GTPase [Altericroceibacterium endophyticum]
MASQMKAPPSSRRQIVDVPNNYKHLVERLSPGGRYIDAQTDDDSPWVPFGDNAAIKHLAFDVRQNQYSNILWVKGPGTIGTHLHRGTVTMVTLEGSVRYLEYDWVGTPGGLILETPGESHTLVTDHPEGCKLFGWMQGPIEFYDEDANFVESVDVWWFINHYETHCREHGLTPNPKLYL